MKSTFLAYLSNLEFSYPIFFKLVWLTLAPVNIYIIYNWSTIYMAPKYIRKTAIKIIFKIPLILYCEHLQYFTKEIRSSYFKSLPKA